VKKSTIIIILSLTIIGILILITGLNGLDKNNKAVNNEESLRYRVYSQEDESHAGAKCYSAIILLDKHYTKEVIKTIIQDATEKIKASNYYRNESIKKQWGESPAHFVWLFLAYELEDIQVANWVCQTSWVDPNLSNNMRPSELNYNDEIGEIKIFWNDNNEIQKENYEKYFSAKEKYLETLEPILNEMLNYGRMAIDYFEQYKQGSISESTFISKMRESETEVTELYFKSGNIPFPPIELEDYDQACQNVFAVINNMFLFYSKEGLETWPKRNRNELMQDAIKRYYEDLEKIRFEEKKIH
jgi:hypothetical protein